jgi:hypothetical protein
VLVQTPTKGAGKLVKQLQELAINGCSSHMRICPQESGD